MKVLVLATAMLVPFASVAQESGQEDEMSYPECVAELNRILEEHEQSLVNRHIAELGITLGAPSIDQAIITALSQSSGAVREAEQGFVDAIADACEAIRKR